MIRTQKITALGLAACLSAGTAAMHAADSGEKHHAKRNVILFIADGLRHGSVNETDAPTMLALRNYGVHFVNSHALFPTFTTANASAMATGHLLGDTGDYSNTIFTNYPLYDTGNFGFAPGTVTPFVENNQVLTDLNAHFDGDYLNEDTLLQLAREAGLNTASVGKVGPVGIQDASQLKLAGNAIATPQTVFIDDATGGSAGIPLRADIQAALTAAGLPLTAPNRSNGCAATAQCNNGFSGNNVTPGTTSANYTQQNYFADAFTKAVLPTFVKNGKPFAAVFWSRDPDGTQHNQGDSLSKLTPGINGPTSKAAIRNADNDLAEILNYIAANPELARTTDIIITSDHGFATISHHETDTDGGVANSYATAFTYKDATGRVEVNPGFLPVGFLAIDLAHTLNLPLFDPDSQVVSATSGKKVYEPVDPTIAQQTATVRQHPAAGDGLIGGTGQVLEQTDAKVVVAANGGSDLIYVPDHDAARVRAIVKYLVAQPYTGALFVDDTYGPIAGALPFSSVGLFGDSLTPRPTIAISFKTLYLNKGDLQSAVQIADSGLQEGQGMHGSLGRDNTYNNMAAYGPDFKRFYVDKAPVSNADIARTFAAILGLKFDDRGDLKGRVLREALKDGDDEGEGLVHHERRRLVSEKDQTGKRTVLYYQRVGQHLYFDEACRVSNVGDNDYDDSNVCR